MMTTTASWLGEVERRRNRRTGTLIVLLDLEDGGDWSGDPEDGRWMTVCDEHGTCCQHRTRKVARSHVAVPAWCEPCQEIMGVTRTPNTGGTT